LVPPLPYLYALRCGFGFSPPFACLDLDAFTLFSISFAYCSGVWTVKLVRRHLHFTIIVRVVGRATRISSYRHLEYRHRRAWYPPRLHTKRTPDVLTGIYAVRRHRRARPSRRERQRKPDVAGLCAVTPPASLERRKTPRNLRCSPHRHRYRCHRSLHHTLLRAAAGRAAVRLTRGRRMTSYQFRTYVADIRLVLG